MADRPQTDENMALSSDTGASQQTIREITKEESEFRATQSNSKTEAPKKKTTFKITSVTKSSSQRGGNGDLTQDIDADSVDELDETVDSHTEDLSSEIYDLNSRATDVDSQDPLLSPEEVVKEKPGRFKVVKIESKEPFKRGRWLCYDYLDVPEKSEPKPDDSSSGNSVINSVHYTHGYDDPLKNPLLAGGSGSSTIPSRTSHRPTAAPVDGASIGPGEIVQPMAHAASQPGQSQRIIQAGQPVPNASYSNHVAQSMPVYSMDALPYSAQSGQQVPVPFSMQGMLPGQSIGHSLPASGGQPIRAGSSVPNLQQQARGQTQTSQSLSGTTPYSGIVQQQQPHQQQQPVVQGTSIPVSVHSQPAPVPGAASVPQPQIPGAMHEYMNSVPQGMGQPPLSVQQQPQPQPSAQQQATGYHQVSGSAAGVVPEQNHLPPPSTFAEAPVIETGNGMLDNPAVGSGLKTSHSSANLSGSVPAQLDGNEGTEDGVVGLVAGLEPLQIAVGGITNANLEEDTVTEDAFMEFFSLNNFGGSGLLLPPHLEDAGGSSTVAIDNKIEQAMDLVKSHLMYAVREEVEVLKEQIKELMERLSQLEYENSVLRAAATPDTLAKLTSTPQSTQPPSSSTTSS